MLFDGVDVRVLDHSWLHRHVSLVGQVRNLALACLPIDCRCWLLLLLVKVEVSDQLAR